MLCLFSCKLCLFILPLVFLAGHQLGCAQTPDKPALQKAPEAKRETSWSGASSQLCHSCICSTRTFKEFGLTMARTDWVIDTNSAPLHSYPAKWEIAWTVLEAKGEADVFRRHFVACFPFLCSPFCLPWTEFGKRSDVDFDNKNFCDQKHLKTPEV